MSNTLGKIRDKVKKEGIGETAHHLCRAGAQRTTALLVRLKRQYELKNKLPQRIEKIREEVKNHPEQLFRNIREATLSYIKRNHKSAISPGAYSYKPSDPPLLYASCYAALTRHLYNDLDNLPISDRKEWIKYIQSFQTEDGLFRDPLIDIPLAEEIDWWGWRHLTLHVLMALTALGGTIEKPFRILDPFKRKGYMTTWIESRNWKHDAAHVSNEIQNFATILQYVRDFQDQSWCLDVLNEMYDWLDHHQDPQTGLWGTKFDTPASLSNGVQTGYHLWLLYSFDYRPIRYVERIIDSCMATQNPLGGFGVPPNSSACEDIDSIDPLVRFYYQVDYRRDDIRRALSKAMFWVLANLNPDGGWVFRRHEPFQYGHKLMLAHTEQSSIFPTWFRTLSLAYMAQVPSDLPIVGVKWQFLRSPGHQFWHDGNVVKGT